jgi:hypothetical protein
VKITFQLNIRRLPSTYTHVTVKIKVVLSCRSWAGENIQRTVGDEWGVLYTDPTRRYIEKTRQTHLPPPLDPPLGQRAAGGLRTIRLLYFLLLLSLFHGIVKFSIDLITLLDDNSH